MLLILAVSFFSRTRAAIRWLFPRPKSLARLSDISSVFPRHITARNISAIFAFARFPNGIDMPQAAP